MLFVNLCSLIDGKLKNEPSITAFSNLSFDSKKVKIGDLFIGKKSEVREALKNGAYGVISTNIKVLDDEIAWIEVDNLELAKIKFLRFLIIQNSKSLILLDNIELEFFKSIVVKKEIFYIDNIEESIKKLFLNPQSYHIVLSDKKLLEMMNLKNEVIINKNHIKSIKNTLFLTTFTYKDRLYKDIKLSLLFQNEFENVLNICDFYSIEYNIQKLNFINHFKPIFLDSSFRLLQFGHSTKVVIVETDSSLINKEINYIKKVAPWASFVVVLKRDSKLRLKSNIERIEYKDYSDLKSKNLFKYNFAIMVDSDNGFENYLIRYSKNIKNTLF